MDFHKRFYIGPLGTLDPIFFEQKHQKWTFQKVYMWFKKKFIEIEQKFMKLCPDRNSGKKKAFFFPDVKALGSAPLKGELIQLAGRCAELCRKPQTVVLSLVNDSKLNW